MVKIWIMARLFLIPNLLGDSPWQQVIPSFNAGVIEAISCFIVEDVRNARRFLKKIHPLAEPDKLHFFELNKHTSFEEKKSFLAPLLRGHDTGLLSEAGCPGIADPGAEIVRMAHESGIRVVPLVGPSSILLALMASGLNGQDFAFNGYLPVKQADRVRTIRQLERNALSLGQTQIFIETPYRNNQLIADLLRTCQPETYLCIAANLTLENETILTNRVFFWKKNVPFMEKVPVVFLLGGSAFPEH